MSGDGFRVAIKASARRVLDADSGPSGDDADEDADVRAYPSRAAAAAAVDDLEASTDGRLELQAPAPNDSADVDAYLVWYPADRKRDPDGSLADGWTFDTTANQYGAIGETLLTAPGTPALDHFVRQDLSDVVGDDRAEQLSITCRTRPGEFDRATLRSAVDGRLGWTPDCEVRVALPDRDGYVHRYFCEVKTGDASFERNQVADMEAVSLVADVLTVRVSIDGLPDEYSVTIRRVGDSSPDLQATLPGRAADDLGDQAGLSEFLD